MRALWLEAGEAGVSARTSVICVNVASGTGLEHVAGEAGEFTHVMR